MCINTGLQIVNGRYSSDADVGTFTCITDRSASTINYILADRSFAKYITEFQVGNRLESIHMPLILDFQYGLEYQNRAARFVTRNYDYETGSMTGILGQLKWESLKKRRKDNRLILLYKGLKGKAKIPTDDLIPKTRHGRNQHSLAFQIPSASKDVYMYSFFPQTIRDWNDLPESLISSSELSDDSVSKFTSLVRARD